VVLQSSQKCRKRRVNDVKTSRTRVIAKATEYGAIYACGEVIIRMLKWSIAVVTCVDGLCILFGRAGKKKFSDDRVFA